jgi:hypothetical protein
MNQTGVQKRVRCVWYWLACAVLLLTAIAHTIAILQGPPPPESEDHATLLKLMQTCQITLPLTKRTMDDLLHGFNWFFELYFVTVAMTSIVIRRVRGGDVDLLRLVAGVNVVSLAGALLVSLIYFFVIPISFVALAMLFFAIAYVQLGSAKSTAT